MLFNRAISGIGFGITKTGTGKMQTDNFNTFTGSINIDQGTLVANTFGSAGQDLNAASAINLGGGTLQIGANTGVSKTYATVPVNVNSNSTLEYKNVNAITYTEQFTGASAFALNADLAIKNVSTDTTLVNALNIGRNVTGTGDIVVETYNNVASSANSHSIGRILLSGSNSAWSGDLVVAKGTVSLGGNAVNAAGTGVVVIGTASDSFGAGLTFFPQGANGTTVTYSNNITVRSGGFRSIKGSGTDHSITLSGDIALEGSLNVDQTLDGGVESRLMTLSGSISGVGGLEITRVGGATNTAVLLSGTNTYTGATSVTSGRLVVAGTIGNSAVTVSGAGTVLATDAASSFGSTIAINNGAILAAGDAGAAGTATVTGATTFNNGAIFSWDINATGTSYDKLISASLVDGDTAGGSVLRIVASDADFINTFWDTTRTWTDIFTTNGSAAIANWANIFSSVTVVNSSFETITPMDGSFSVSGNTLTWSAVPEPTSALAGLLLAGGLLRRRRA